MTKKYLFLLLFFASFFFPLRAQLVINEVTQGYSGNQEYVELLVVGTPTCNSIPCVDLRGYYIDDNNGNHATGGGVGIAQGCVRFTTDALWSCVPVGTLILIYNDDPSNPANVNPDVPAQDLSLTDGNCKLVIAISNATLFERNTSLPSTASAVYPTTGFVPGGNWTQISMANGGDSFQTIDPSGNQVFSVSWGNNSTADVIYFAASQTGMVCSMTNSTDNNPFNQSNWVNLSVTGNQTPGSANNAANATWINSMNNSCTALTPLTVSNAVTNAGCTCTGSATVTASGAIGPYTYSWAPSGGSTSTASNLCAGNYTVTVTSSNGCSQTTTLSIASISPITATITSTNISCNGAADGSATVTTSNTSGAINYSWTPSGGNSSTATGLAAGNYTVSILDTASCTATATVSITQPPALTVTPTQTNVACNGGSTAAAAVNVSGGTSPYSYTWTPSGGNTSIASALSAGNYSCSITDNHGCSLLQSFNITQPPSITVTPSQTNVSCNGGANGTASVTVSGGTGAYSYTWTPAGGNSSSVNGLSAGNYTATVADANSCISTQTFVITQPTSLSVTPTQTNVSCNGGTDGAAAVAASGGTGAFSYSWQPGGGSSATASGLAAGNYTCTVTDANGCNITQTFTLTSPLALTITPTQTNVSCNGGADAIASVSVNGGAGGYSYTWTPTGGNSATASNLAAGNYTLLVTDANACSSTQSFSITQPLALSVTPTQTNISCNGGANGVATATAAGGTAPYTFSWSPAGGNTTTANNLSAGNYTVNISDSKGCVISQSYTITQPAALTVTVSNTSATCHASNGTATATVSGGTTPYSYTWSPAGGNSSTISGLAPGNYSVQVLDINSCAITGTTSIVNVGGASVTTTNTPVSCFGGSDGSATANAVGGVTPYSYSWAPTGGSASVASGLNGGQYTVTVTDGIGCITTATTSVSQPTAISTTLSATSVSCFGGNNGALSSNSSGGSGPYTYSWVPSGGNSSSATNLTAGNYSVTVTDANGCTLTSSTVITQPAALTVSTTTAGISCNGGNDGSISSVVSGGTPNYSYSWQPSGGNGANATSLVAGNYTVVVTDANGCVQSAVTTLSQPQAISATLSTTPVTCNSSNGTASSNVTGGTAPYTYSWLPAGGSGASAAGLAPGTYTLIITDNNGCVQSDTATVQNISTFTITMSATMVSCNGASDGSASANVVGGTLPYSYAWQVIGGSAANASNLAAGNYSVIVTDANNCAQTGTVAVTQPAALTLTVTSPTVCSGQTASVVANASGGNSPYQYSFNGGAMQSANSFTINPSASTSYSVIALDNNGCSSPVANSSVVVLPPLQVTTGDTLICPGTPGTLTAIASGGNGNYTYLWQPGNLSGSTISVNLQTGTIFTVTVSDGCTTTNATDTGKVSVYPIATPTLSPTLSGCAPLCVNFTVSASASITNYQWSFGDNSSGTGANPTHCYQNAGAYNVGLTYTTTPGCANTVISNGMVNVFGLPDASFSASSYETTTLDPQISFYDQSTGAISWQWNFGDGSSSIQPNPIHSFSSAGDYPVYLLVTNQQGCKDSVMINILVKEDFTFFAPNAFSPNGDNDNDIFLPSGIGWDNTRYKLWIYDRWGNLVISSTEVDKGWDGTKHGAYVQEDVYVWDAEVHDLYGMIHKYHGTVSLIR